jgi:hypothetical protein
MTKRHDSRIGGRSRVGEPVQVYLTDPDRDRLERLAAELDTTKSDVLRRGLEALEAMIRRDAKPSRKAEPLPTYRGKGLQSGIDLDDTAGLFDLMEDR